MSTKKQSLLRIIAATSVSIFTLLSAFFGSYAWFVAMRASKSKADPFTLVTPSFVKELNIYKQDSNNASSYVFSQTPTATYTMSSEGKLQLSTTGLTEVTSDKNKERSVVDLGTYDPLYNKQNTLLFEFTVDCAAIAKEERTSITLQCNTDTEKDNSLVALNPDGNVKNTLRATTNNQIPQSNTMSSVIEFHQVNRTSTTNRYDFSSDISSNTAQGFVSLNASDSTTPTNYQKDFSFTISTSTTKSFPTTGDAYISLILEYNVDVMEYVLGLNTDLNMVGNEEQYSFWQDWTIQVK